MASVIENITNLPTVSLVEAQLRRLLASKHKWHYIDIKITHFDVFDYLYGWMAGDEVLRLMGRLLGEVVNNQLNSPNDYLGHLGRDNFALITQTTTPQYLMDSLCDAFDEQIKSHYTFIDRERGYMVMLDSDGEMQVDLLGLAMRTRQFTNVHDIDEWASEDRRKLSADSSIPADMGILMSW